MNNFERQIEEEINERIEGACAIEREISNNHLAALKAGIATELDKALSCIDWQQVVLNGGPPCFFIENGRFCLAAKRWAGHGSYHQYVSLADLIATSTLKSDSTDSTTHENPKSDKLTSCPTDLD